MFIGDAGMKKFKVITHKDLDGVGCGVVARSIFRKQYVFIKFVDYKDVNQVVRETLLNESDKWDHVFITDISVDKETAELIESDFPDKVNLIDHHPGLDWLNEYNWALVSPGEPNKTDTPSGTSLFYEFLQLKLNINSYKKLEEFTEIVRKYDTWIWHTIFHDDIPKKMNDYLGMVGFFDFMDEMVDNIINNKPLLSENAELKLKVREKEIDVYIKTKNKQINRVDIDNKKVGFVYAENFHSELGNKLMEMNPDLDLVIIVDLGRKKISIRSVEEKHVDCTEIAKEWYGGGGHKCASGAMIPDIIDETVKSILFIKYKVTNE